MMVECRKDGAIWGYSVGAAAVDDDDDVVVVDVDDAGVAVNPDVIVVYSRADIVVGVADAVADDAFVNLNRIL